MSLLLSAACTDSDPGYKARPSASWIAQLADSSETKRVDAASALGQVLRINPGFRPAVQGLIRALADTADGVRLAAAGALSREGVRAPDAVPGLIVVLADSAHASVRAEGARVLGTVLLQMGISRRADRAARDTTAIREGTEALVTAMSDSSLSVRLAAARGLRDLGPLGAAVSPRVHQGFVAYATSPLTELRMLGLEGLVNTGAAAQLVLPAARAALTDSQALVRLGGVTALSRVGPPAAAAIPDLERTLRDANSIVRTASASAIGQIAPDRASAALQKALKDPEESVRREAAHALEGFHRRGGVDEDPPEPSRRP